jgi:hypothetical protein
MIISSRAKPTDKAKTTCDTLKKILYIYSIYWYFYTVSYIHRYGTIVIGTSLNQKGTTYIVNFQLKTYHSMTVTVFWGCYVQTGRS